MHLLKEISLIAAVAVAIMNTVPEHYWMFGVLGITGYGLLCFLSAWAFRDAASSGFVRKAGAVEGGRPAFFISKGCPHRWLVQRHIRIFG